MIEVIFDTETTGLILPGANDISKQPYITDIYCHKQARDKDGNVLVTSIFHKLLKPPIPITAEITKITGVTDESRANSPSFVMIWEEMAEFFCGVDRMVAHNVAFDRSMLANELLRCDKVLKFPWPRQHICTVEKSLKYEQRRLNLTRLHEYLFGTGFVDAHTAKGDVVPLVRCYNEMVKRGDIQ
jgi:DNA polymerase III epsilon subunit-like protein